MRAAKIPCCCLHCGARRRRPSQFRLAQALARWRTLRRTVVVALSRGFAGTLVPNYSVKWTAANRHGIFMQIVAAATYLKR